jgi:hypothetical protein
MLAVKREKKEEVEKLKEGIQVSIQPLNSQHPGRLLQGPGVCLQKKAAGRLDKIPTT